MSVRMYAIVFFSFTTSPRSHDAIAVCESHSGTLTGQVGYGSALRRRSNVEAQELELDGLESA